MVSSYEKSTYEKKRGPPEVSINVQLTSQHTWFHFWNAEPYSAQSYQHVWHLPTHLFLSPIWQVKTEHLALCKEKSWSHAINSTWGRIPFVYGLGESTAQLVLEWLILMLGRTLFCLVFPVFKGRYLWITNRFLMGKYWMKKTAKKIW